MKQKAVKAWSWVTSWFPQVSPIGRTAFNAFAAGVLDTYGLPNTPGYRQAIAQMILQSKSLYLTRRSVAHQVKKAQVNQTAYQLMQEIQAEEKAAKEGTNGSVQDTEVSQTAEAVGS